MINQLFVGVYRDVTVANRIRITQCLNRHPMMLFGIVKSRGVIANGGYCDSSDGERVCDVDEANASLAIGHFWTRDGST